MKYIKTKTALLTVAALALATVVPEIALAQTKEEWVKPAVGFIDVLQGGLVQVAAAVIGIGIIVIGAYTALTGHFDGKKLGASVFGGILVMAGPKMLASLLTALQ